MKKLATGFIIGALSLTIMGCSNNQTALDINVNNIFKQSESVAEMMMPVEVDLTDKELAAIFPIDSELVQEGKMLKPGVNVKADEITVIEAKPGKEEEVKKALEEHINAKMQEWERYLPDQYELVKNHQLIEDGNVFAFIVGEYADEVAKIVEDEIKAAK